MGTLTHFNYSLQTVTVVDLKEKMGPGTKNDSHTVAYINCEGDHFTINII